MKVDYPIQVPVMVTSEEQLAAVYAVLGSKVVVYMAPKVEEGLRPLSNAAMTEHAEKLAAAPSTVAQRAINYAQSTTLAQLEESDRVNVPEDQEVDTDETPEIEVDSDGLPFDPETMTGTKLKSGQWRMKNGVARPAAPNGSTSTANITETASTPNTDAGDVDAGPENEPSESDDEDEFAAFRDAAAKGEPAEAAPIAARTWTDADLGALCNQAALKLGDPEPIKKLIASFTPEGQVAHSRNIPQDQREAFAVALEQKADIEFAG